MVYTYYHLLATLDPWSDIWLSWMAPTYGRTHLVSGYLDGAYIRSHPLATLGLLSGYLGCRLHTVAPLRYTWSVIWLLGWRLHTVAPIGYTWSVIWLS